MPQQLRNDFVTWETTGPIQVDVKLGKQSEMSKET
jgi:hypothetical protein